MLRLVVLMLFPTLIAMPLSASEVVVGDGLVLSLQAPDGWAVFTEAPEALIRQVAEHVAHEAEAQGYHPTPDQAHDAAVKRLAANEAIVYHAASNSHIDIDFSPVGPKEKAPLLKTLLGSAEYALQSLESEEGVSGLQHTIRAVSVAGAGEAARLEANYKHHDETVRFIGVIGYVDRAWFFLYATVFGGDQATLRGAEAILGSVEIRRNGKN